MNNMNDQETIKNKDSKEVENKVWIGDDGIIYVTLAKNLTEKDVWDIVEDVEENLERLPNKAKILVNMTTTTLIQSSQFRKTTAEKIKKIASNPKFGKAALYAEAVIWRTIASFILMASGTKNVKVFNNEKKALDWLKKVII